jgi:type I restriction enzyme R subunit
MDLAPKVCDPKGLEQQTLPRPQGEGRGEGGFKGNPEPFTTEQLRWLEMIRDHIAANLSIEADDFDLAPFAQEGGLGKVYQIFGNGLNKMLEELNATLAA